MIYEGVTLSKENNAMKIGMEGLRNLSGEEC